MLFFLIISVVAADHIALTGGLIKRDTYRRLRQELEDTLIIEMAYSRGFIQRAERNLLLSTLYQLKTARN